MEKFIDKMEDYASMNIDEINSRDYLRAEINFRNWQDQPNKHFVTNYYADINFGLCYVKNLYSCRVESFYEVLIDISTNVEVKREMMGNLSITSFGCGPGPEIAAYVSFMRSKLHVSQRLDFTAVDKIAYWKSFLAVTKKCDRNITLSFQNATLSPSYLQGIRHQGVCIMSYPEAVNFGNIWHLMTEKFRLIIILDQSKPQLHANLRRAGFTISTVTFKGQKRYAYYLSKNKRILTENAWDTTYNTLSRRTWSTTYATLPQGSWSTTYAPLPQRSWSTTNVSSKPSKKDEGFWNILGKCTIL